MTIDIAVVGRWVLSLLGIFGQHVVCTMLPSSTNIVGHHVARQSQTMAGVGHNHLVGFVLIHHRRTQHQIVVVLLHARQPLFDVQFQVATCNPVVIVLPIPALFSCQGLDENTWQRVHFQSSAKQRVVYSKASFFVSAQHEARPELFVKRSCRELHVLRLPLYIIMRHAPTLEIGFEAWQGILQILQTQTHIDILERGAKLYVSVVKEVAIGLRSTRLLVVFGHQHIRLYRSAQG